MILAGDIGGTKTVLCLLIKEPDNSTTCVKEVTYASQQYATFDDILVEFLPRDASITSACFGVAGPVVNQVCKTTNLPWLLDSQALKIQLHTSKVKLLNDLEAMALGMLYLQETDLIELNPNAVSQTGTCAVIAAGTGLGEALLYWDEEKYHPMATEGGHSDFAAQTAQQDALLVYLRELTPGHVSYERILSGVGFSHLYDFLRTQDFAAPCAEVEQLSADADRNAVISGLGLAGTDPLCVEVLRLFVEIYGSEAGNLALKSLATGGVFIGGGIGVKILPAMQSGQFIKAFKAKGRFEALLNTLSVKLSINQRTPLIGAIHYF